MVKRKQIATAIVGIGLAITICGFLVCLTSSYSIEGVDFYPLKSRVTEGIGFLGLAITIIAFKYRSNLKYSLTKRDSMV
jgi:hypothetical protein